MINNGFILGYTGIYWVWFLITHIKWSNGWCMTMTFPQHCKWRMFNLQMGQPSINEGSDNLWQLNVSHFLSKQYLLLGEETRPRWVNMNHEFLPGLGQRLDNWIYGMSVFGKWTDQSGTGTDPSKWYVKVRKRFKPMMLLRRGMKVFAWQAWQTC